MNPNEIKLLELYLQKKFALPALNVRKRPQKNDSVEVNIGDEFIGVIYRDDDEGEVSYAFQMAILEIDLDEIS